MSFINHLKKEINCKVVYYGAGLCGKTANLEHVYGQTNADLRGKMITLTTETERTLFFDFLPLDIGKIGEYDLRFHLYTVPGQVFYDASRKLIVQGADGLVFVADSQDARSEANEESLENLSINLEEHGRRLGDIPYVIQYNKRDMPDAMPLDALQQSLNPTNAPYFEAVAIKGEGVYETLKGLTKLMIVNMRRQAAGG
jgi:signal recognition particle receptor subunit beta